MQKSRTVSRLAFLLGDEPMDFEQAVAYIEALPRFAGKPSLLPMQALMQALDNPQKNA